MRVMLPKRKRGVMVGLRNDCLQSLCRDYLCRLRVYAVRHGLCSWLDGVISANERGECVATDDEVAMLSRCLDDERVSRKEIPSLLCKSYRGCVEDGDFDKVNKLHRVGIYSKLSVLLLKGVFSHE